LPDADTPPEGSPFSINRSFDEQTGYRTKSMLVVPMRTPQGETIGVLQLINCKPGAGGRLVDADDVALRVQPFGARYETLAGSLASQAAVALANSRLFQNIRQLFEGFVGAAVTAIESRDPTTSGHSFRVSELTVGLAEAVDRCEQGPYATARFTTDELMELRYAALLHDFGKVGVREHVLLKAKKLYPGELDRIRQRVALIKRGLELKYTGKKLETLLARGRRGFDRQAKAIDAELAAFLGELDDHLDRIVMANEPSVLPSDVVEHLRGLALQTFEDHLGNHQAAQDRKSTRLNSSHGSISYAVFCLKKKNYTAPTTCMTTKTHIYPPWLRRRSPPTAIINGQPHSLRPTTARPRCPKSSRARTAATAL